MNQMATEYSKCLKGCGNQTPHKSGVCMPCRKALQPPKKPKVSKERIYMDDV